MPKSRLPLMSLVVIVIILQAHLMPSFLAQTNAPLCAAPLPRGAFPRPTGDNGWGIHWAPGAAAQEPGAVRFFVDELRTMNIKWVKILNRRTDFAMDPVVDALVSAGMMPVMRIQEDDMEALYPPTVEALVRHYRLRGVYYYELYNEPNLLDEWPVGAEIDIGRVVDVWIPAAAAIQRAGGFPSTPGLAPGGHWEDMDFFRNFLAEVRRRAQGGDDKAYRVLCGDGSGRLPTVWVAVHNYGLNHYFDYPRDSVNLSGAPVTAAEATRYGIPSDIVNGLNEVRARRDRPFHVGDQVLDDSNGFFKFWAYAEIYQEVIGYIPPILVTEGGWLPGEQQDPRYPPVTDEFLTNETLRAYEYMLAEAPDFLIAWMPWILCNFACNGADGRFEPHAWYKGRSSTDTLPVVQALKRSPNRFLTRTIPDPVNLPWPDWIGQGPVGLPANITLVRTPIELVLDVAARLGRAQFVALGGNDQVRVLPDPVALTNRFLVKNVSSRKAHVNLGGEPLDLAGFGTAIVEIRPHLMAEDVGEAQPVELSEQYAERVAVSRLPDEDEAEFQARASAVSFTQDGVLPIGGGGGQAALQIDHEFPFGIASFHRLSCDENQRMANLFVEVRDELGQPLNGVKLLFNTADGVNPVSAFSGDKNPGTMEFPLVAGTQHGGNWSIEVDPVSGGSPRLSGLRTDLPDDPCPSRGNSTGHYSYRVVFQRGAAGGVPEPREPLKITPESWTYPLPRPLPEPGAPDPQPKPLAQWPRPENDNGRGLHFLSVHAFNEYALDLFIYHLVELDMRWALVYYSNQDSLTWAAQKFKEAGIMVVWRPHVRPYDRYPTYLIERDMAILRQARMPPYIQLYNEPTVGQEWDGQATDLDLYVENFILAADDLYRAGGYIGFQDVDVESLTKLLREIKARGKDYLFSEAFFVPHCYGSNHPPAYPYDPVNQAAQPGATIETDYATSVLCFLKFARVWQTEVGFVPPMVMGEGGWVSNTLEDDRYPRVTLEMHRDYHLELFEWFRTGRLSNGEPLPDYLFAVTPWLVNAAGQLHFEEGSWFYSKLTGTKYETIEAVRVLQPFVRQFSFSEIPSAVP